jgi:hypothetical protein
MYHLCIVIQSEIILQYLFNTRTMAKEIKTEILIKATPERIWSILSNFGDYPKWNPFIKSLTGEVRVGNTITVKIQPPESKVMTFKPVILTYKANKELSWIGHLLFPGLFDGEHKFELIDNGNETTSFKHSEKFKGILVGFLNLEKTKSGFQAMNEKLKELAEH